MSMVLIRMLTSISGIGIELSEGDEELFPVEDARRFVERALAEPANDEAVEALRENPPAADPPAEDPPAEDPPAEDPPAEDPPAEDPPAEDPPAEDPPAEGPPAEDPPAEDPPAVADELDDIANTMKLKSVARAEGIDLGEARSAADIRAAIRGARAAKAA